MKLRELRLTYAPVEGTAGQGRRRIAQPRQAAELLTPMLQHEAVEVFMLLLLDTKLQVIAVHTVARGTLDATMIHPRDVFKAAILANAAMVITAHNHPSGDPTPSPEDMELWGRLNSAGSILGVECADHMVIGDGRYWSLREIGGRL